MQKSVQKFVQKFMLVSLIFTRASRAHVGLIWALDGWRFILAIISSHFIFLFIPLIISCTSQRFPLPLISSYLFFCIFSLLLKRRRKKEEQKERETHYVSSHLIFILCLANNHPANDLISLHLHSHPVDRFMPRTVSSE